MAKASEQPPRPLLHVTPARGWLNDPNGLVQHQGRHHWFFQYNPHDTQWGNLHWGHVSSIDLIHWNEHPIALAPGAVYDADGCWSGGAWSDVSGVRFFYTGVRGDQQLPCLAASTDDDLVKLNKSRSNPLLTSLPDLPDPVTAFRDPMLSPTPGRPWRLFLAGGVGSVGTLFQCDSSDGTSWSYTGEYLTGDNCAIPGEIWECPDVFALNETTVAIVSVLDGGNTSVWWVAGQDQETRLMPAATGLLDHGDRFYAPQSYRLEDGRRILTGWLRTHVDGAAGSSWAGALALPRELGFEAGHLHQLPARELAGARLDRPFEVRRTASSASISFVEVIACELLIPQSNEGRVDAISLLDHDGEGFTIALGAWVTGTAGALQLFFDAGIVEIFAGGRTGAWSNLTFSHVCEIVVQYDGLQSVAERIQWWALASSPTLR